MTRNPWAGARPCSWGIRAGCSERPHGRDPAEYRLEGDRKEEPGAPALENVRSDRHEPRSTRERPANADVDMDKVAPSGFIRNQERI